MVGMGKIFSYLRYGKVEVENSLRELLEHSVKTDTPVLIKFDGENWWDGRPDLWNWWDPAAPGYNPGNKNNVEWTGWDPDCALKIAWRNWGRQIRIAPPPNLMSPAYRRACEEGMDGLMPIVMEWWKGLPEDKKHLFIGINVGWESSIGLNAYYYPNGNELLDKPEEDDPPFKPVPKDVLSRGKTQIGYASIRTAGIRTKGDIAEDDLYEVVRRHLEWLSRYVYDFGFPREKIFTHGTGDYGEKLFDAAVNPYSCPGWSNYRYADDPGASEGMVRGRKLSDARYWATAEWLLQKPREKEIWLEAFERNLSYPDCKWLGVYNWRNIKDSPGVIQAARELVVRHRVDGE